MINLPPLSAHDALLRIDLQNDFFEGGALAVPGADARFARRCNAVARHFRQQGALVVDTQDYHPAGHSSFASSHPGAAPFSRILMPYGQQVLWPDHCMQGLRGAEFHPAVDTTLAHLVLRKGMDPAVDSYSAFRENDRRTATGLAGYLDGRGIVRVWVLGLAQDYCCFYSAADSAECGYDTYMLLDHTLPITAVPEAELLERLRAADVTPLRGY